MTWLFTIPLNEPQVGLGFNKHYRFSKLFAMEGGRGGVQSLPTLLSILEIGLDYCVFRDGRFTGWFTINDTNHFLITFVQKHCMK